MCYNYYVYLWHKSLKGAVISKITLCKMDDKIKKHNSNAGKPPVKRSPSAKPGASPDKTAHAKAPHKKKKKHSLAFRIAKKLFTVIMTTLLSLVLIMIVTGTIVCTALTAYVLDFMDETTGITLQELESGSDTIFYALEENEDGTSQYAAIKTFKTDVQRIPITIDQIPQHVRDTFVYTEDERFYTHDGVDYKRTFSAFLNMFLHIYDTEQGGSTITQQLIKNLTGDSEHTPQRKIREIFSAMQLEKTYSKDEILEEYLNYIGFGGPINGIELASIRYFGKNTSELSVAEAATLAAIPKSPNYYNPTLKKTDPETGELILDGRANNKERQQYVLWQVYKNGAITYDEYQQYLDEKLIFTDSDEYLALHPEDAAQELENEQKVYSWTVDAIFYEAQTHLCDIYNIDREEAAKRLYKGGYKIYATVDMDMQKYVEEKMLSLDNILDTNAVRKYVDLDGDGEAEEQLPHVAFTALGYDGSVLCTVGNVGEKKDSRITSFATTEPRQIGSTMKPISTYGLALESDTIHWGSQYRDEPIMEVKGRQWPTNYSTGEGLSVSHQMLNIYYALQKSYNTIPAKLCEELTPNAVYNFCRENMDMKLDPADEGYSPLSVGALTYGITLQNLVNAYIPYGNKGVQNEAHIISKIEQGNHDVIYENNGNPHQAVSAETAWVMNRLLKNVVENGTGTLAKLDNKVLCGKTGTTDNWYDLTFVGLTRDFVSGITIGYKAYNESLSLPTSLKSAKVWKNIIGDYADSVPTAADFDPVESVIESPMCTVSGMIAGPNCPKGVTGYWKSTNAPTCSGSHYVEPEPATDEFGNIIPDPTDAPADPNAPTDPAADPNAPTDPAVPQDPTAAPPAENPPAETPQEPAAPPPAAPENNGGGEAPAQ